MKEELVYVERQCFNRWLLAVNVLVTNGSFFYVGISRYFVEKKWGNNPMDDRIYIFVAVFLLFISVGFFFIRLDTVVNNEGVYYRMFPFHPRFHFQPWEFISEAEVMGLRKRGVIFRGYGIRFGFRSQSYTISGSRVLLLTLNNNKKIYIGTRKPEELSECLIKLHAERKQK